VWAPSVRAPLINQTACHNKILCVAQCGAVVVCSTATRRRSRAAKRASASSNRRCSEAQQIQVQLQPPRAGFATRSGSGFTGGSTGAGAPAAIRRACIERNNDSVPQSQIIRWMTWLCRIAEDSSSSRSKEMSLRKERARSLGSLLGGMLVLQGDTSRRCQEGFHEPQHQ